MPLSGSGSGQQQCRPPLVGLQGQRQAPEGSGAVGVGKHCDGRRARVAEEKPQQFLEYKGGQAEIRGTRDRLGSEDEAGARDRLWELYPKMVS